ncbi:MAG TPA: 50S ribosomal protein L15 [Candidatus Bipolaricaulota bacterium]|nr:50S ribosomal protein L15 [Candidatus Bipolaricaulota bacterium]
MQLHTIKSADGKKRKRIGRGNSSGHGTYSGRGQKGQKSRSGGKKGLKLKGFKRSLLTIPKLRGFHSQFPKMQNVNLTDLEKRFNEGELVTPVTLADKNLIKDASFGVKILSDGKVAKKLQFKDCHFSKAAAEKIAAAGGVIESAKKDRPVSSDKKAEKK